MEAIGRELALSISVGPSPGLRRELRELFPQGTALRIELLISAGDVAAETPNIIALSQERWQLRLCPQVGRTPTSNKIRITNRINDMGTSPGICYEASMVVAAVGSA